MDHNAAFYAGFSEDIRGFVGEERRAEGEEKEGKAFHASGLKRGRAGEISASWLAYGLFADAKTGKNDIKNLLDVDLSHHFTEGLESFAQIQCDVFRGRA